MKNSIYTIGNRTRNLPTCSAVPQPTAPPRAPIQLYNSFSIRVKGKAIPLQAWKALRVPGGTGSQISRQSAHEGGKVVSSTHRQPLPPQEIFLALISVRGWVNSTAIVQPEGICPWKIPFIKSKIEPATFRLVAQCLNQPRHRVPCYKPNTGEKIINHQPKHNLYSFL